MEIEFSLSENIAIHRVTGELDPGGLSDYVAAGIAKWTDIQTLWDLSSADLSRFSIESAREIVTKTRESVKVRQGKKTAILSRNLIHSGVLALFVEIAKTEDNSIEVKLFQSRASACSWLLS